MVGAPTDHVTCLTLIIGNIIINSLLKVSGDTDHGGRFRGGLALQTLQRIY